MELTVDQMLQQAVAAHNQGNLQEAERLYRAILQSVPTHPDANHNLGLIAVAMNQSELALPMFKTAIDVNPNIEQFWVSYIDALVKANQLKDAKQAIKKAKKKGFDAKKLQALLSQSKVTVNTKEPSQEQLSILLEHYHSGQFGEAEKLALSITEHFPEHEFGWTVLGAILGQTGRIAEALNANQRSVQLAPQDAAAHNNLGSTLHQLDRLNEAEACYTQAIALKPDYAEAHNNLGATLQELGRLEEAEASSRQAIALQQDYAAAHNNLGNTLHQLDRLNEAEASLRQAIALKSDLAEAHNNLGNTLKELGRVGEAIDSYIKALKIESDHAGAYNNIGIALSGVVFQQPNSDAQDIIMSLLNHRTSFRPRDISKAAISLLKFEPIIQNGFKIYTGELRLSLQEVISGLSELPLLLKLMSVTPLPDLELEAILMAIRSDLLSSISEIMGSSAFLRFQSALALLCFTNEYVYGQTDNETKTLQVLESVVKESLLKGEQPSAKSVLCLATYKALDQYEWCDLLTVTANIEEVFTRQVVEPKQEIRLKSDIPILQEITGKVSSKVREQYEENPYPRWVSLGLPSKSTSIYQLTKKLKLSILDPKIYDVANPTILIGGCGTGRHSIISAATFKNSTALAVDLSLASLAYAKRQTRELGLRNIEYMQADILDLGKLNRQFDIVESAGVLHHMDDPMVGWRVLTDCLKPGGLMKIGLYSELARQHIVKIREEIDQSGIGSSAVSIKKFRRELMSSNEDHHRIILDSGDFYSTSEVRDLLFHVQEHRFTLPQIQDCLSELNLKFCGFDVDSTIVQGFKKINTGIDDHCDLNKWNVYENANPMIFAGMYQFWCQKAA
jgi:tetratricopeptide (TPR) repeat protein/SAM-dependent methyltransferase